MIQPELPVPGPAYRILTPRLVLRCWEPRDAPALKAAVDASLAHLAPWLAWARNEPTSVQDKIDLLRTWRGQFDLDRDFVYGIFGPDERWVIGSSGLHTRVGAHAREIAYWIRVEQIGRGYATEATAALTRVGFEIEHLTRIDIRVAVDNERSANVPRKLGYTHEATLRRRDPTPHGTLRDVMLWTMLADEYPASPAATLPIEAYDAAGRRIL
ncbi:MAG: GNAT family protein [Anaerolineae bacterium]|nr:GNAT family N-acetyltransferase [Thermoflexales bacterium]MDW8407658.1 GNAT family protein [Anaerolineae bacterium]